MILIFGMFEDHATKYICNYLDKSQHEYVVLKSYADFHAIDMETLTVSNKKIKVVWYRKHQLIHQNDTEIESIHNFLDEEYTTYTHYFDKMLEGLPSLGKGLNRMDLNKPIVLRLAQLVGLNTPKYIVTTSKSVLVNFQNQYKKIITKPLANPISYYYGDQLKTMYTKVVTEQLIEELPDTFFPSFFQEYIEKEMELRIFYLDGHFFSAALINQTGFSSVDIREVKNVLRTVPFSIPEDIEFKLKKLMDELDLNTGSIDMILGKDHRFYFLEINPSGIFDGISDDCNFGLHELIANWLMKYNG